MALTHCWECGKEVSDVAPKCPHCGAIWPGESQKTLTTHRYVTYGIMAIVLIMITIFWFNFERYWKSFEKGLTEARENFEKKWRPLKSSQTNPATTDQNSQEYSPTITRNYLAALGITDSDDNVDDNSGLMLFMTNTLSVEYAFDYHRENPGGNSQDHSRVPLPNTADALRRSASLGRQVIALVNANIPVTGVTTGTLRPEIRTMAVLSRMGGGTLKFNSRNLMPGKRREIRRDYTPDELAAIRAGSQALGLTLEQTLECLGDTTFDIYLNDVAYWCNVPKGAWKMMGYQNFEEYISEREKSLLGRPLPPEEAQRITYTIRRGAALLLMQPALNANYQAIKNSPYIWPGRKKDEKG